jgi:hypothetical protein
VTSPRTAAALFERFLRPLYPPDLRDDAALAAARTVDANPAKNANLPTAIARGAELFAQTIAPQAFGEDLALDFGDASIHRLGAALDRRRRDAWIAASTPGAEDSPFALVVIHGAFYVGECVARAHGGAWSIRRPLWESLVTLESRAGRGDYAPLSWILQALSDDEIDAAGLVSRYRQYVERATLDPRSLPPIVTAQVDRKLPTLKQVRYDTLHKHLRAHLPELKDLGRDFPSPEQFADIGFLELELSLLGEGRMLLMHGRGKRGLHLFWLDAGGFSHAAFFQASPGDPHRVEIDGDRLRVTFVIDGRTVTHETLWWG